MARTLDELVYVGNIRNFIIRELVVGKGMAGVEAETTNGILVISAPDRNVLLDVLSAFSREKEFNGEFGIHIIGNTKAVVWSLEAE
jgi:hypothetical protein